jgi:alkanesulfonate monooxygenase SsuD/methylene tetrahydromethanopterin reductase-like flavin-dependent oxidoreductase (luciferase family)
MPEAPSRVKVGFAVNTFYDGATEELREMMRLAPDAESAGFDSVWVGDHILWHTALVDGLTLLSTFVPTTRTVELGTGIYLLGLRQPAIAAKALTSLSALTEGRLVLGVGVGGENPAEFAAAGVDHARRGALLDEALAYLDGVWDGNPDGMEPTGERPRVLIGGRSAASRRRIVSQRAGWLAAFVSPQRIREEVDLLSERSGEHVPTALHAYTLVGDDEQAARAEAGSFLSRAYAMPEEPLMRYTIVGTAQQCLEQIATYVDAGVRELVLRPASWDQRRQLERWAEGLLPGIAALGSPAAGAASS